MIGSTGYILGGEWSSRDTMIEKPQKFGDPADQAVMNTTLLFNFVLCLLSRIREYLNDTGMSDIGNPDKYFDVSNQSTNISALFIIRYLFSNNQETTVLSSIF